MRIQSKLEKRSARVNLYMKPSTMEIVRYYAVYRGLTVSTAIENILDKYLSDIKISGGITASEVVIPIKYKK